MLRSKFIYFPGLHKKASFLKLTSDCDFTREIQTFKIRALSSAIKTITLPESLGRVGVLREDFTDFQAFHAVFSEFRLLPDLWACGVRDARIISRSINRYFQSSLLNRAVISILRVYYVLARNWLNHDRGQPQPLASTGGLDRP